MNDEYVVWERIDKCLKCLVWCLGNRIVLKMCDLLGV